MLEREQWILDFGSYTPSRELLEDMNQKETLLREYAQLVDIKESTSFFYFLIVYDSKLRGIVIDKKNGLLKYNQMIELPQIGGGIKSGYIENVCFWPSFISGSNIMYALLPIEKIADIDAADLKQYLPHATELTMEANPVVLKVYGK